MNDLLVNDQLKPTLQISSTYKTGSNRQQIPKHIPSSGIYAYTQLYLLATS